MDKKKCFFHLYADGEDSRNFIVCEQDKYAAFNRVGICALASGVQVVTFSVEESHIHSLQYGYYEQAVAFKEQYELLTVHYIVNTRGSKDDVFFHCDIEEVKDQEYLRNVGVYTIIQPTKDGKQVMPYDYLWGSGSMYFRSPLAVPLWLVGVDGKVCEPVRIGSLPLRARQSLLHSKHEVPSDWLVCNGFLLPSNYIDVSLFEQIYGSFNRYRVFLGNGRAKNETVQLSMAQSRGVEVEDIEARRLCSESCYRMFGRYDPRALSSLQRLELAMDIRRQHRLSLRQISTVVRLPEREVRRYLDRSAGTRVEAQAGVGPEKD